MAASTVVAEPKSSAEPPFPATRTDLGKCLTMDPPLGADEDDLYSRLKSLQR